MIPSLGWFLTPFDIKRIDLSQCSVSTNKIVKLVVVASKEKRFGSRITKTITIHQHFNDLLCPALAYLSYQSRIASDNAPTPHPVFVGVTINALFRNFNNHYIAIGRANLKTYTINHAIRLSPAWYPYSKSLCFRFHIGCTIWCLSRGNYGPRQLILEGNI
jgi:hypothetical protein